LFSGLLASARELRNPLTVGYAALLAFWLVAGEAVNEAALEDPLGRRLISALDSMGDAAAIGLYTFAAAMIGSLLWSAGVSRFVRFLSVRAGHPDWDAMIEEARGAVRRYEEYQVTTYKGASGSGKLATHDARHKVPSPRGAAYLHERVEERERKSAEMSFRVTLAVALLPVALALGVEGGGSWWWWLAAVPVVWFDVALLKYTTLRTVRRYDLENVEQKLEYAERSLETAREYALRQPGTGPVDKDLEAARREQLTKLQEEVETLRATKERLRRQESRPASRIFAFLEGRPTA
jgi:hypothetical protein